MQEALTWGESGPKDGDSTWEALWKGVQAAKRDKRVLGSHPEQPTQALLRFLVAHGTKRKVLRSRAGECLTTLLSHDEWLRAATACPELKASLITFLGDEKSSAIFSNRPAQPTVKMSKEEADLLAIDLARFESDLQDIQKRFVAGVNIIKEFKWSFPPPDSQTAASDTATEGFRNLQTATRGMCTIASRKNAQAKSLTRLLHDFDQVWPSLCQFLASMRQSQRKTYIGQIDWLVAKLSEFSPNFAMAAEEHFYVKLPTDGEQDVASAELVDSSTSAASSVSECVDSSSLTHDELTSPSEDMAKALEQEYDEEFRALRSRTQGAYPKGTAMQWMWADARVLPIPGLKLAAAINPARWSEKMTPQEIVVNLSETATDRPVRLHFQAPTQIDGQIVGGRKEFHNAEAACRWILEAGTGYLDDLQR